MKKIFLFAAALFVVATLLGQVPASFKYQAVLRDTRGNLKFNTSANIGIDILQGGASGTIAYSETHYAVTDGFGLISLEIGNGNPTKGLFSAISWGTGTYFVRVMIDGVNMGTTQLLSVPYALYAKTAESVTGAIQEKDPLFTAWNKSSGIIINGAQVSDLQTSVTNNPAMLANTLKRSYPAADSAKLASLYSGVDLNSRVTGVLPLANGGTGSSTKNFVDLTTDQTVAGNKIFSGNTSLKGALALSGAAASQALFTDAGKNVVSNPVTGSGNVVMSVSPALTGTPSAPTAAAGTNTSQIATTSFVAAAVSSAIPDATELAKGKIQLSGDLGGPGTSAAKPVISDNAITTVKIQNSAVTTAKIADASITNAKLDKSNIPLSGFGAATSDVALGAKKLTGVADPVQSQDAATKNYVDASTSSVSAALSTEINNRSNGEAALTNNLISESTRATLAELTVTNNLSTETTRATAAEGKLTTNLANENTNRTNADALKENLVNKSTNVTTDGTSDTKYPSVKSVKTYVDASASSGSTALATEKTNRTRADSTLTSNLASEATRAAAAETTLTTNLATENTNRTRADSTLTSNLAAEATRAIAADSTLTINLATEVTNRTNADALKENLVNKSTNVTTDGTSDTKYPSVKSVKTYVDSTIVVATPDATTLIKGKVQLAGDLRGTGTSAAAPVISDNAITTVKILNDAITTAKILDANVTTPKIADANVTTAKLADASVTNAKLAGGIDLATKVAGILPVANGGTGSATKNFMDLTTAQTIAGNKTLSGNTSLGGTLAVAGNTAVASNIAVSGNSSLDGTLAVTGVTTLTAAPILSSATASQALFTDASKNVVSNAITGTGNVVMSVSPTLNAPNLGTPSALVGTNITGTASGLTAGSVTTNANLTGDITSVGNVTTLSNTTVSAATYGSATTVPVVTVDAKGRVTGVTITTITGTSPVGSSLDVGKIIVGGNDNKAADVSMTGDITMSFSGATAIGNGKVTYAKIQNVSETNKVLGRTSAGAGVVEEISTTGSGEVVRAISPTLVTPYLGTPASGVATNLTGLPLTTGVTGILPVAKGGTGATTKAAAFDSLSPMTTLGDITYGGTSGTGTRLAKGTNGQVLTLASGLPTWAAGGVPYIGATGAVDLGAYDLTVNGLTVGKGAGSIAYNTAIGNGTLSSNSTGTFITATGAGALNLNTTGNYNTATGAGALSSNTSGNGNTANGSLALYKNDQGSYNTATGDSALINNTSGTLNSAYGWSTIASNTTGMGNTAIGALSLTSNTTGVGNTAIGVQSLTTNTSGTLNTAIGVSANVGSGDLSNATAIGSNAIVAASNTIQLGNDDITNVKTNGTITAGTVTYPNTTGSMGYYLKTDGMGTASWAAINLSSTVPYTGAMQGVNLGMYGLTAGGLTVNAGGSTTLGGTLAVTGVTTLTAAPVLSSATASQALFTDASKNVVSNAITGTGNVVMSVSPTFTGTPTLPTGTIGVTQAAENNSTAIATTAFVTAAASSSKFVDLTTAQTVAGIKTFSSDVSINGITVGKGAGSIETNTANGVSTLSLNTTGYANTAAGAYSLESNTTGYSNTATGQVTLNSNTKGHNNTANGTGALNSNTEGNQNTATGQGALQANLTGSFNTVSGVSAMELNTTGSSNTAIGVGSLSTNTSGSSNTAIGIGADVASGALFNATAIGAGAIGTASNTIQLGNIEVTNVKTSGTLTAGEITYPNTAGTSGDILTTNGTTTASWATPGSFSWGLTGNTGTDSTTNFIGTTDNKALVFKVNSEKAGEVSSGGNTSFGYQTLNAITTGVENTANGKWALYSNKTGSKNTANGSYALSQNTGSNNTANGFQALYSNTTGYYNTANGVQALFSNTTATSNTANGFQALYSNTTGYYNTANGTNALFSNTTGANNTANGVHALYFSTTATSNTANGFQALLFNTTGSSNTANGYQAGIYISDGSTANETSSQSVYLGASTKASASGDNNEIVIGYDATGAGSNTATLGNTSITSTVLRGNVKHYGTSSGYVGLQSPAAPTSYSLTLPTAAPASNGLVLSSTTAGVMSWATPTTGTVTSVTGTGPVVSTGGSTPAISIPAATNLINGYATSAQIAAIEANTAKVTNATHTGDAEGDAVLIVKKINGVALSGLATGILKNTTTTGVPSIAVAGTDYLSPTSGWSLSGNTGTDPATNFIGTTDDKALVFKVNSQKAGEVSSGTNTSFGYQTLFSNTTGSENTANGYQALYSNTTGSYNTANGFQALFSNTTGSENTANGYMALFLNTTGVENTANGFYAMASNTTGSSNTANGYQALSNNTTGVENTANGFQALFSNTTGTSNTAIGFQALYANTGTSNTANGYRAGNYISDGSTANATSSQSVYLGASTKALANNQSNEIVIGYDATGAGSNTATLGNTSITSTVLRGNVKHYGTTSGYVGLQSPATVATPYSLTLPTAAPASNGLVLSSTTAGVMSWATPTTGTVTSVTGTGPVVSTGGSTPAISIPAATNSINGYATSAQITAIEANTAKVTNATHTGEVTGSTALTIANDAVTTVKILNANVTYAKIQAVSATSKLLGSSSTTTPVQELSLGSGLSLSGTTLSATGGTVTAMSATGAVASTSSATYILFSGSTASQTITLPSAVTVGNGREFTIKNVASVSVSIAVTDGKLITDNTTLTATSASIGIEPSNNWMKVISDGTNWYIIRALY